MSTNEARQLYQTGRRYAAFALLLGLLGLVSTALMWQGLYRMNLMSTLGIIGGVLYAGLGFRLIQTYRAKSFVKSLAKAASIQDRLTQSPISPAVASLWRLSVCPDFSSAICARAVQDDTTLRLHFLFARNKPIVRRYGNLVHSTMVTGQEHRFEKC